MKPTEQTLLEQLRITEQDIARRKEILTISDDDISALRAYRGRIEDVVDEIVDAFYEQQLAQPEVALLIGDADTLSHVRAAQRKYILSLFSGQYGLEYVNNRLRIGHVHKRIGVGPRLFIAATYTLKELLNRHIGRHLLAPGKSRTTRRALEKLLAFDSTLIFETYNWSMVNEVREAKDRSDRYAHELEQTIQERTRELEALSLTDERTGLLNVRALEAFLTRTVRGAERRNEPVSLVFFDVDEFKRINDTEGHQRGDEILQGLGETLCRISRAADGCFRYGGDEFCVVLPDCTAEWARDQHLARFKKEIATQFPRLSISCGIAQTGPETFIDPIDLLNLADRRMYEAKEKRGENAPGANDREAEGRA